MLTAILTYLVGFIFCAVITYFVSLKEEITVGDFIALGIISLSSWAGVVTYVLGGIANIVNSLGFNWMKNVVIKKSEE